MPELQRNELLVTEVDTGVVRHLESEAGLFKLDARFSLDAVQPLAFELYAAGLRPFDDDVLYTDAVRNISFYRSINLRLCSLLDTSWLSFGVNNKLNTSQKNLYLIYY